MNSRVGQVWNYGGDIYLVVDAPFEAPLVREVMNMDVWYHPCRMLNESVNTVLGESEGHLWEDTSSERAEHGLIVSVRRERIT